jgi:hypothetical protein
MKMTTNVLRTAVVALSLASALVSCGDEDEGRCAPGFVLVDGRFCERVGDAGEGEGEEGEGEEGEGEEGEGEEGEGEEGEGEGEGQPSLSGFVRTAEDGTPIAGARVTVHTADLSVFEETRSAADGSYSFGSLVLGPYAAGASAPGRDYVEVPIVLVDDPLEQDFSLGLEQHQGRWSVVGSTEPEYFAGTPSATLMPDGRVIYCHNTLDPVVFDPATGETTPAAASPSSQGCHMQTVLSDGRILFAGGQDPDDPGSFVNAVRTVKTYDPVLDEWTVLPELNEQRWYPTLIRLADERLLACGGGQRPDASRTDTCELFDPATELWTPTGSLQEPTEYSPSALLYNGLVLTTWSPPQLYDPASGEWRPTGDFVQTDRGYPDHSVHSLVLLPDGTALAVGNRALAGDAMVEAYDPGTEQWSLRASPEINRSRPEVLLLPDGKVFCTGGKIEELAPEVPRNNWDMVALTDLYDPAADTWRSVAPMALAREYHALTLLAPDGRVLTTSGTSNQASGETTENSIEAFEPPYLFRGVRPLIDSLSSTDLTRGGSVTIEFSRTRTPTAVVLLGTGAVTHWMEGGVPRLVRLAPQLDGQSLAVDLPADPLELPTGYYVLYLMVDDIPSEGRIVRVAR